MISSVSIVNVESNDNVIYINNDTVEIINTKFNHNTTSDGNDMFVLKNGELKLTKTEIIENTAINANMLDAENENVVLNKTTLKQNNVGSSLLVVSDSSLMIENYSKIESNEFDTSKPSQLIYVSNGGMTIDTEMNIKSNTALNPSNAIIDVNNNLNIFEGRTFEVTDNAIVSSANNRLIFVNVRNYNIALNAKNCMSTAIGNENIISIMYLTSGGFINISTSSIIVKDNASIGDSSTRKENHFMEFIAIIQMDL